SCAPVGIRTPNLLIRSQMLYPLSYRRPSTHNALRRRGLDEDSRRVAAPGNRPFGSFKQRASHGQGTEDPTAGPMVRGRVELWRKGPSRTREAALAMADVEAVLDAGGLTNTPMREFVKEYAELT